MAWFLIEKNFELNERQRRASEGKDRLSFQPSEISKEFTGQLELLEDANRSVAPIVALAAFSHKFKKKQSPEEQVQAMNKSIYYMSYMTRQGLFDGFAEYNRVIRGKAMRKNVILITEENSISADDVHFHDSIHFTDVGSQFTAECILNASVVDPGFRQLRDKTSAVYV